MNTQYFITLSQFLSNGEMFHLQMHLLYSLIDTMSATHDVDPRTVLNIADKYFKQLRKERSEIG